MQGQVQCHKGSVCSKRISGITQTTMMSLSCCSQEVKLQHWCIAIAIINIVWMLPLHFTPVTTHAPASCTTQGQVMMLLPLAETISPALRSTECHLSLDSSDQLWDVFSVCPAIIWHASALQILQTLLHFPFLKVQLHTDHEILTQWHAMCHQICLASAGFPLCQIPNAQPPGM